MKILIIDDRPIYVGSKRVFADGLHYYLSKFNDITCTISDVCDTRGYDVVIYGKHMSTKFHEIKKHANQLIGTINPNVNSKCKWSKLDFIIVGSLEERDSLLSKCNNVFIFPLVETFIDKSKVKVHNDTHPLVLGYHGNSSHLTQFENGLREAIEIISNEVPVVIHVIHGNHNGTQSFWTLGRPKGIKVIEKQWDIATIQNNLLKVDVGLCPNNPPIDCSILKKMREGSNGKYGDYPSDYIVRFKNKSNAGRTFLYHQLGIPVIASFTPSHFHILGNPENGFVANSCEGWLSALRSLVSAKERIRIGMNGKREFERQYDMIKWVKNIINGLKTLK